MPRDKLNVETFRAYGIAALASYHAGSRTAVADRLGATQKTVADRTRVRGTLSRTLAEELKAKLDREIAKPGDDAVRVSRQLQAAMEHLSEIMQTMSNLLKKMDDKMKSLIQNVK